MKFTRRTNVFIKTERKFIAASNSSAEIIQCPHCTELMTTTQICADFFNVSSRTIYRLIEAGKIHFIETAANTIYICPLSLKNSLETIG